MSAAEAVTRPASVLPSLLLVFGLACLLALALTPPLRDLARQRGFLDRPDGARKRHLVAVPRLGGLAVYLSFALALGAYLVVARAADWSSELAGAYGPLLIASTAVLLVGLLDDVLGARPLSKILVQAAAGAFMFVHGYRIELISNPLGEPLALGALSLPLTLLWFVGMSNALNLMDGLDGLAAGVGLFAVSASFLAALLNDRWEVALFCAALAGALLGFLRYNFSPASVFLGDCGSLFLGFMLAALAVRGSMKSSTAIAVFAPLLALGLPILDTTVTVARRLLRRRSIFEPDAEHIHHRLLRQGLAPTRVVFTLYGVAALFGALSLLTVAGNAQVVGIVVIVFSTVSWFGVRRLGYPEFGEMQQRLAGDGSERTNAVELSELRRRFARSGDLAELWQAVCQEAPRFGFSRLELQLEAEGDSLPRLKTWQAGGASAAEEWSWTIPLVGRGRTLGRLGITGSLAGGRVSAAVSDLLDTLGGDLAAALERLSADETGERPGSGPSAPLLARRAAGGVRRRG